MAKIPVHSNQNFAQGFERYLHSNSVIRSNSWQEYFDECKELQHEGAEEISFKEYKAFNLTLNIEQLISSVLFSMNNVDLVDLEKVRAEVLKSIKSFRRCDLREAEQIIFSEFGNETGRMLSPHGLLYVSGMTLGKLIYMLDRCTNDFESKNRLITDLFVYTRLRNDLTHNVFSSRFNLGDSLDKCITMGIGIHDYLDKLIDIDLVSGSVKFKPAKYTNLESS